VRVWDGIESSPSLTLAGWDGGGNGPGDPFYGECGPSLTLSGWGYLLTVNIRSSATRDHLAMSSLTLIWFTTVPLIRFSTLQQR